MMKKILTTVVLALMATSIASAQQGYIPLDPERTLYLDSKGGRVIIALSPDLAQKHVAHFKALVRKKYYDGLTFYRVIDGFVAQGGKLEEKRDTGDLPETLKAEFDEPIRDNLAFTYLDTVDPFAMETGFLNGFPTGRDTEDGKIWHIHCSGALAAARTNDPDTGGATFYITLQPQRYLDRNLTVFGRVIKGMEVLQRLTRVTPGDKSGRTPDVIDRIRVAADLPEKEREKVMVLDTNSDAYKALVKARATLPGNFFHYRPNTTDVCAVSNTMRRQQP